MAINMLQILPDADPEFMQLKLEQYKGTKNSITSWLRIFLYRKRDFFLERANRFWQWEAYDNIACLQKRKIQFWYVIYF